MEMHTGHHEHRLRILIGVVIFVIAGGTIGYMIIEGWNLLDSLYMTLITITTIGFREVHALDNDTPGRIFTVVLIIVGVGSTFYALNLIFQMFLEGHIRSVFGRRKMRKEVRHLKNHYIVCGYGRVGQQVVQELLRRRVDMVVIESRENLIEEMAAKNILFVPGDSTSDEILIAAGVRSARGLIIAIPGEADNVFIALSARQLNPELIITARADSQRARSKIIQAGADQVICPHEIGGMRMAMSTLSPNVVDFMKVAVGEDETGLRLEEIRVGASSRLEGVMLRDSPLRAELDIVVVAIKKPDRKLMYNPRSDTKIEAGDILIVIGESSNLTKLQELTTA
jgi:voltage-gated potassium channel